MRLRGPLSLIIPRYNRLEDSFGACRALTGSGSTPEARAQRAWTSGLWARLVLDDIVPTPRPAAKLPSSLRPRFYIVLRCDRIQCPALFTSGRLFKEAVGALENSSTVCQAFASLSEVEVFCDAAGIAVPGEQ